MKYTISIVLVFLSLASFAQKRDSVAVKKSYLPTGVRVGTDLISVIRTWTDESFSGYEFNADIDFYRYYLAVEVGHWERTLLNDVDEYQNTGEYFRVGVDVNFLLKDPDRNMLFFGLRYGHSTFTENFSVTTDDAVFGLATSAYSNANVNAGWAELTGGLRVKMFKFFWMGYTARYKFGLNTGETGEFVPHDVPGYGKTANPSTWGFNYQILFRIPVRKHR